ncbi:rhomboid domain-containing protein 2-like [Thalassophryne amazonica]|uniref:rhomboid domain-containing protein 2-like n=1 Tax=Thalassophryne amazonica TaxID=390379 RepID=UPI001471792A|nr:rhomboid domain-containing protein 2-like [Thalassophryne amazonica]
MKGVEEVKRVVQSVFRDSAPVLTCGILTVALLSSALFGMTSYFRWTQELFSVGGSVFRTGHVHRLLTHTFSHSSFVQLLLSINVLLLLSGTLEKGVGTVRFLLIFLLLSLITGLCYSLVDLLQEFGPAEGLVPVALACAALTSSHSRSAKAFLCGLSLPIVALPWLFLVITTVIVPHSVLPCNIIGVLIGWMFGRGWFSLLDTSEAEACLLEKTMPFRVLRRIGGVLFVPASVEERRKTLLPLINPTPGSYPVQAYAPVSSMNRSDATGETYEGWPNPTAGAPLPPHSHDSVPCCEPSHSPGPQQSVGQCCNHDSR